MSHERTGTVNRTSLGAFNTALLAIAAALALLALWERNQRETWRQKVAAEKAIAAEHAVGTSDRPGPRVRSGPLGPGSPSAMTASAVNGTTRSDSRGAAPDRATRDAPTAPHQPLTPEQADAQRIITTHRQHQAELNTLNGYDDGFVALQLPAATVERAKQIILDQQQALESARKAARTPDEVLATLTANRQALQDQLTAVLGEGVYQELEAYHRESSIDWALGTDLWDAGVPLSRAQLHALALTEVQMNYQNGRWVLPANVNDAVDPVSGLNSQDMTLLAQSSRFLSPAQQMALRQSLIDEGQYNAAMRAFEAKQRAAWQAVRGGKQ